MNILLINPSYFEETYKNSKHKIAVIQYPPLNLALLAAHLKARGHEVEILDLNLEGLLPLNSLPDKIRKSKPDLVGLTMTSSQYSVARQIVHLVKSVNPNLLCVVGGPHASALPAETLTDCGFDVAVLGEGETTLARLAAGDDWKNIPNLCYQKAGAVQFTSRDYQPLNMDELEFPDWNLFDLTRYRAEKIMSRRERVGPLETSRGCPYRCIYCNKNIFGYKFFVINRRNGLWMKLNICYPLVLRKFMLLMIISQPIWSGQN
jgi:anaerobic magnesium-protoporphyrin IX monomethyl ester cyclase